ncbi:MAG: GGDEF domain-containing protein [Treponema sp.]|nr:GGDEF domain-containing protein [Treponema sp.]
MKMKSIRTKLTFLLFFIALIPLIFVIGFYFLKNISKSIDNAKSDGLLRNSIINEHITEHFEKTFAVLRTVARNPMTIDFVTKSEHTEPELMEQTLRRTNDVFNDSDNMIITDKEGDQLARSDSYPLINVGHRRYFHEAMHGSEYISDVLISLANNRLITVLEVPVFDEQNNAVGMVQRDYDLSDLQNLVKNLSTKNTRVIITDGVGNVVSNSEDELESNQLVPMATNPAVSAGLAGKTGSMDVLSSISQGTKRKRMLVTYSRNEISGWVIITERSYSFIWFDVIKSAATAATLGGILILVIALLAAFIAEKATRKIRAISALLEKSEDSDNSLSLSDLGDDELGQMVSSINKIRNARDSYRKDAEIDKLTGLLNKATFERLCRRKISENQPGTFSSLIIIDLDHFKNVNDSLGHQAGDALLHDFGEILRRLFRPTDLVGRFGGDEFVVFLNDLPGKEIAISKAKRIVESAASVLTGIESIKIGASVGISSTPQHGNDYDSLFSVADKAVYAVKESGRNGVCYGSDGAIKL